MNIWTKLLLSLAASSLAAPSASAHQADFANLAERVTPAVVNIFTTQNAPSGSNFRGLPDGHPLQRFLERFGGPEGLSGSAEPIEALGSGFILDAGGYVLTNHHVVDDTSSVRVMLPDEREFNATIVGTDERTDIALLKIDHPTALPFVRFGNSDAARVGEDVMAVGNAFGFGGTVTTGIISGKGRSIRLGGPYIDYIQTDAAINRGNSGGPLFNTRGEVIGVNTAIFSPTGGSVGIGFAVPSNVVSRIVADLKDDGRVERGWLGVSIQPMTDSIALALGLSGKQGALISGVDENGPAHLSLRSGDVILSVNGQRVKRSRDLPRIIGQTPPRTAVPVIVLRDGVQHSILLTLGQLEDERQAQLTPASLRKSSDMEERFGAALQSTPNGVVIAALEPSGPARKGGLERGDVILRIDNRAVSNPQDIADALNLNPQDAVLLLVRRGGAEVYVGVDLSAS